jgi:hypothetical protein
MKRLSPLALAVLIVAAMSFEGCVLAKISGRGPLPLMLNNPPAKVEVIQNLSFSKMRVFDYTGAFDVSEVLSEMMVGANASAIINLNIVVKTTVLDYLLNLITLGLAQSRTFEVQGQVVKAPQGLGMLDNSNFHLLKEAGSIGELGLNGQCPTALGGNAIMLARTESGFALIQYNPNAITVINED